jgi:hypothetical protein
MAPPFYGVMGDHASDLQHIRRIWSGNPVQILLPITFLGSMFLLVLGMALGHPLLSLVASIVVFAFFLQFGYVAAALFKYSVGPVLAARGRSALGSPRLR